MTKARAEAELTLAAKVVEIAALRRQMVERAHDEIVAIAQIMAERIIGEQLAMKPDRLLNLAQRCMLEARGASRVALCAHPDDAALLSQHIEHLNLYAANEVRIQPDPGLLPGDLRIETDVGTVDARIGTQLANLATIICESLRL